MIETYVENWHKHMRGEFEGGLDELLADDCIFYSPVVFTPQKGKELTKLYLMAAGGTFSEGNGENKGQQDKNKSEEKQEHSFRYVKEVCNGLQAVLEFESYIEGKYMNGVDIITFNEEGKIIEFKVMMRPLQAINLIHEKMKAMLEQMQ
jgi:hypothetical protein